VSDPGYVSTPVMFLSRASDCEHGLHKPAFSCITINGEDKQTLSFGGLYQRVLILASEIVKHAIPGDRVRNGSVATWRHFNLHGEFDFSDDRMVDSVGLTKPKNKPPRKD
jgi:hypothetical protein